jgi:hypothetical protein
VAQIIAIQSFALAFKSAERSTIERELFCQLVGWVDETIGEIHSQKLRRPAYIDPLKNLFSAMAHHDFEALLDYVTRSISTIAKSPRCELFIQSLGKINLSIYPSEELDLSLNFVETIASYYADSKGFELREAYSECLTSMLLPLVEVVSAEVNIPKWEKVFGKILLPRVFTLCEKQKYREITVDLAGVVLCLCTREIFMEKWLGLSEAIAILIKEGSLPGKHVKTILILIWVYCNRYTEAFASQTANITNIIGIFVPSHAKRLPISVDFLQTFHYGLAGILGPTQPQSLIRDVILPLLDSLDGSNADNFPAGRVTVAIKTFLYFGSLETGHSKFPSRNVIDAATQLSVTELCDNYVHYKPDFVTKDSVDSLRMVLGKVFASLDTILWDSHMYDNKTSTRGNGESAAMNCFQLLMETCPYILPIITGDLRLPEILLRYCSHVGDTIALKAIQALTLVISEFTSEQSNMIKLYWLYSAQLDKIPDRCGRVIMRLAKLFPVVSEVALQHLTDNGIDERQIVPVLADMVMKALLMLLNVSGLVRECSFIVLAQLEPFMKDHPSIELCKEVSILIPTARKYLDTEAFPNFIMLSDFLLEILNGCPSISGITKAIIMLRLQELQGLIGGKSQFVDDDLVHQWSYYLVTLFCFGAPEADSSTLKKRMDGISLRRLLHLTKSDSNIHTTKGFLRFALANITNDNEIVCNALCDAATALDSKYLAEFFEVLEPYISMVSEDYRNVRYQVLRKNKRQDALKIDLTRLISRVSAKLGKYPDPNFAPHQSVKRYIIEVYYFVSEIDAEESLPGLRYQLAELVRNYHNAVLTLYPRYEFFPFKLQTELFLSLRKWFDEQRLGTMSGITKESHTNESGSSVNSSSMLTFKVLSQDVEKMYAECLASLCHGLCSPLPDYRNESVPGSQVLRWVDSLVYCEGWGPSFIKCAVRNLLTTNRTILEKVIQKIFQVDVVLKYPILSDAYFMAVCEALLGGKIDLPTFSIVALLAFKNIHGSAAAKIMADKVAQVWLNTESEEQAGIIESLPTSTLCMLAPQVVSELVLRVESLVNSNLEGAIKTLLCSWIQNISIIPSDRLSTTLQNLVLLTLRYHQKESLKDSFVLWDAILLWRHHISNIVHLWAVLILRHRNWQLVEVSTELLMHFCRRRDLLPYVVDAIKCRIEPVKCLLTADPSITKPVGSTYRSNEEDFFSSTRLDAILQTSERSSIPIDFTFGHIIIIWASELLQRGVREIADCSEVQHLVELQHQDEYSYLAEYIDGLPLELFSKVPNYDAAVVALQWAVRCPIKTYSLSSWSILGRRIPELPSAVIEPMVPIVHSYVKKLLKRATKTRGEQRVRRSDLVSRAVSALRNVSESVLGVDSIREQLCILAISLLPYDDVFINAEALGLLIRTGVTADYIDDLLLQNIIRGYSNLMSWALVGDLVCSLLMLNYRQDSLANIIIPLLVALMPSVIGAEVPNKNAVEAIGIACNILEGFSNAGTALRLLQAYGRKRYRNPLDGMRDLALIFSDDCFMEYSGLIVYSLIAAAPSKPLQIATFLEHWTKLIMPKLASGRTSPLWNILAEVLVDANRGEDGIIPSVDAVLQMDRQSLMLNGSGSDLPPMPLLTPSRYSNALTGLEITKSPRGCQQHVC